MTALSVLSRRALIAVGVTLIGSGPLLAGPPNPTDPRKPRRILADLRKSAGPRDAFWQDCVGSGHAGLLLRPETLAQLKRAHDEIGFRYVRFHGIFSEDMGVYREAPDGSAVYDFSKVDAVYDALLDIGIRPMIELGFMPETLASEHRPIFYWKANGAPPKDYDKWAAFITAFTKHLIDRFGATEVERWRFEVWNEPNLDGFWNGASQEAYFHLYDVTVRAIKAVDANLPVGGPATAGAAWVPEFLAHAAQAGVPADFVTTHSYGVVGGFLDEKGEADTRLSTSPWAIAGDVARIRKQATAAGQPQIPVYFTEWNSSYSPSDPVHDTYLNAAYVLDKLKKSEGLVQSLSYWVYSDLFEEAGPPPAAFHGGFGLISRDGIPKPAYFAYKYLNALGAESLQNADAGSWLTRDGKTFAALIWDFTTPRQTESDRPFFRKIHPAKALPDTMLAVAALKPGRYLLSVHRTGFQANDAFSQYLAWEQPENLSADQQTQLQAQTADRPERVDIVTVDEDETFRLPLKMRENDVVLVTLKPLE